MAKNHEVGKAKRKSLEASRDGEIQESQRKRSASIMLSLHPFNLLALTLVLFYWVFTPKIQM